MPNGDGSCNYLSIPSAVREPPVKEQILHREFLFDHLDFIADVLTAEQIHRKRDLPACCPHATPETIARSRRSGGAYPCQYTEIHNPSGSTCPGAICECGDSLSGSDDPLDTVAAVALVESDKPASHLYFAKEERQLVADLRQEFGTWQTIAKLEQEVLQTYLCEHPSTSRGGRNVAGVLKAFLEEVDKLQYTEGITLCNFSKLQYTRYQEELASLPGIGEDDAWWLVLTAFDRPIWPADPRIDSLLCSFGLLTPEEAETNTARHELLESEITDRLLPVLHRALAGHAWTGGIDKCEENCDLKLFLLSHRIRAQQTERTNLTAIDLFAGAGGLSCGLAQSGFDVQWAIDSNEHATATYRLNHPEIPHQNIVCDDIREVDAANLIRSTVEEPDLVVGGPPCQSLSVAGYRSRLGTDDDYSVLDDERTSLYEEYLNIIRELQPRALVMENVEGIMTEVEGTGVRVIDQILEGFRAITATSEHGYEIEFNLVDFSKLGLPQSRNRVILIGVREDVLKNDTQIESIFEDLGESQPCKRTIRQALPGLPKLLRGEGGRVVAGKQPGRPSDYITENVIAGNTCLSFNHQAREHPMEKDQRLFEEALDPGDTGWDVKYKKDKELASLIEYDVGTEESPRFKDKYRMLKWDKPAPTVVAHLAKDANSFVLPDYYEHVLDDEERADKQRYRGITPREAARLQSFSDDWIFLGPFTSWFRQIGNAVPPMVGRQIGNPIMSILNKDGASSIRSDSELSAPTASDD